jgi:hypothetical protein
VEGDCLLAAGEADSCHVSRHGHHGDAPREGHFSHEAGMSQDTGGLIPKDPDATNWPQVIDWTDQLAEWNASETISTSTWAVAGADSDLVIDDDSIVSGSLQTQVKLSGGTVGVRYTVTNSIVTSSGITDDRSFKVRIQEQ